MAFLNRIWETLQELAPWLLLGLAIAGLMHVLIPAETIRRRFRGAAGVFQAVLLGIPLPLCSCGVIPAGIGLKKDGASDGAAIGFLISTPQTGIDSILVSGSFINWPFALFKVFVALVTGLVGGWLTEWSSPTGSPIEQSTPPQNPSPTTGSKASGALTVLPSPGPSWIRRAWGHGGEIFASMWWWLAIGVIVSAAIQEFLPAGWLPRLAQENSLIAMGFVLLISVPLYVCATASVPIAASLIQAGLPISAAMVFLLAGPATNIATLGAIRRNFGSRVTAIYLGTIVAGSCFFGWAYEYYLPSWTPLAAQQTLVDQQAVAELAPSTDDSGESAGEPATRVHHAHHHGNSAAASHDSAREPHAHGWPWLTQPAAVILLGAMGIQAWSALRRQQRRLTAKPTGSQVYFRCAGLHCQGCSDSLESALLRHPGVLDARVDHETGLGQVSGEIAPADLQRIVESKEFRWIGMVNEATLEQEQSRT